MYIQINCYYSNDRKLHAIVYGGRVAYNTCRYIFYSSAAVATFNSFGQCAATCRRMLFVVVLLQLVIDHTLTVQNTVHILPNAVRARTGLPNEWPHM